MLTTVDFIVNSFYIRSGLKPHIIDSSHRTPSFDNLSNKPIDKQYFVHGPGFNTPYWNFLAISDNKIQLLHTFISAIMIGSKVYNNNIPIQLCTIKCFGHPSC